jgi:hypothetical protein
MLMQDKNKNVKRLIDVAANLIEVADVGHDECLDENCVGLFGLAKDCGYRIRAEAEREFAAHLVQTQKKSSKEV